MEVMRLRNLELEAKDREAKRAREEEAPHVSFDPYGALFDDEWDGEYKDIAGALRLWFARETHVYRLVSELLASLEDGSWESGVIVPGAITLYGDANTAPTALHKDGGLLERERKEWEAIEWEKETP
jgi:hypothetical protein